ncbi:MAG: hypothetical protein IJ058_09595 [Lachnospiraceae bacterium]|nr:hypothetical protein [Lachnospiraceae bacterium]
MDSSATKCSICGKPFIGAMKLQGMSSGDIAAVRNELTIDSERIRAFEMSDRTEKRSVTEPNGEAAGEHNEMPEADSVSWVEITGDPYDPDETPRSKESIFEPIHVETDPSDGLTFENIRPETEEDRMIGADVQWQPVVGQSRGDNEEQE